MTKKRVVILGAGYAGMLATLRLAGKVKAGEVEVTLVNASDIFTERVRMHQVASNQSVRKYPIVGFLRGKSVDFLQGRVIAIDVNLRQVIVQSANGEQLLPYDNLIYALGSYVDRSRIAGVQDYAYSLDKDSVAQLHEVLPEVITKKGRFIVVGSGLTGIEAATEFAERYPQLRVMLLTRGELGDDLSTKGQVYLRKRFAELNIDVMENTSVERVNENSLLTTNGDTIAFDICLWSAGFAVPQLAKQAGIAVNEVGQVWIDDKLRSLSHPEIFAVGDSSALIPSTGLSLRMACATAMPMSAHAVDNLIALYNDKVPESFAFGYALRCISLGRRVGLVQLVNADDTPKERIITGRLGATIKEGIVKFTIWALRWERRLPGAYFWAHSIKAQSNRTTHNNDNEEQVAPWKSLNNTAR